MADSTAKLKAIAQEHVLYFKSPLIKKCVKYSPSWTLLEVKYPSKLTELSPPCEPSIALVI
jgi:hypothetical protein